MSKGVKAFLVIAFILIIDQSLKIWVKTHMMYGDNIAIIGSWFNLHFIENEGMAFGYEFGGSFGKLILSLFRIVAVFFIFYWLYSAVKRNAHLGLIICISLILAGAIGNIIDSVFYGVIFNNNFAGVAHLFPKGGGYAPLLHGRVVDMLYFPIYQGFLPQWIPFMGGKYFVFFDPVFNIADSSITIGVIIIILFQKKFFKHHIPAKPAEIPSQPAEFTNGKNPVSSSKENHINNNIDN